MKTYPNGSTACVLLALVAFIACSTGTRRESVETLSGRGSWARKVSIPIEISEVAVVAANSKIYVIGGSTRDRVDQPVNFEYDIASDTWRARAVAARADPCGRDDVEGGGFTWSALLPPRVMATPSIRFMNMIRPPTRGAPLHR